MKRSSVNLVEILVERIESMHPAPAVFSWAEMTEWPTVLREALVSAGIIAKAERADVALCLGCDMQCTKPVTIRVSPTDGSVRAFITCDEEPDLGRIRVQRHQLQQYSASLRSIGRFISQELDLTEGGISTNGMAMTLGEASGRNGGRRLLLRHDAGRLWFAVGEERVALAALLRVAGKKLTVDSALVKRMLNRKQSPDDIGHGHVSDRGKQAARRKATAARDQKIYQLAMKLKRSGALPVTEVAAHITKMKIAVTTGGKRLSTDRVRRIVAEQALRERKIRAQPARRK
jgi:hypothetical protein